MTKRRSPAPTVTQAQMRRARKALEKDGLPFAGYRIRPDGSVEVLVNDPVPPPAAPEPPENEMEKWKKRHGRD